MAGKLTPKQAIFIAEYLVDANGTRAAIAAGVSEKSASVTAARWLKSPQIAVAIAQRQAQRAAKLDITAAELDRELMRIARSDVGRFYDENGMRIPVHLLDEETRRVVASVEDEITEGPAFVTTRKQRLKLSDKIRAIELLYKRGGFLVDRSQIDARVTDDSLSDQERALKIAAILNAAKSRKKNAA